MLILENTDGKVIIMEMSGKASYYAFISHKSADRKFALKLQNFIESYNLPTKIRKKTQAPKRLSPVCSYEVDFSARPLMDEMKEKLARSQYLVLICSKDDENGGSRYVNYEIETFIECKRAEGVDPLRRIIPIIVNGEFGSPENECCPKALKDLGENCPIAVERSKYKSDREVFLHAISGMLDIDYAVLKNRDDKRRRKKQLIWGAAALMVAIAAGATINYVTPKRYHYLDFVMQDGLPVGIEKLSAKAYEKTEAHYVLTTQMGRVVRLEYVNSCGEPIDHSGWDDGDRPCVYEFDYDSKGLDSVVYYDRNQTPYFVINYSGDSLKAADFKEGFASDETYFIGQGYESDPEKLLVSYNTDPHGNISRFGYIYDENGYVTKITFHSDSSDRMAQDNGVYGFEYELDEKGRIRKTYYLDAIGERRLNSEGIYCKEYVYDAEDNLTELKNYNKDGKLTANAGGVIHLRRTFDSNHNIVKLEQLDADGNPVAVASYGGAVSMMERDSRGNILTGLFFDENGEPCNMSGCYGYSYNYDKNGRAVLQTFLDARKNPMVDEALGFAIRACEYDGRGNVVAYVYMDEEANPVNNAEGFSRVEYEYNDMGEKIRTIYYDTEGKLADYNGFGYSIEVKEYDSRGRETAIYYLGPDGEPVNILGPSYEYGYFKVQTEYEYGAYTKITTAYYDRDGNPVNVQSSSMGEEYSSAQVVVQNGKITSMVTYDKNMERYGDSYEVFTDYNAQAETLETMKYFDQDDNMYQQVTTTYDIRGVEREKVFEEFIGTLLTEKSVIYYDESGERASAEMIIYDESGAVIEKSEYIYDSNGEEESSKAVYYNENGLTTETFDVEYLDGGGNRYISISYDESGNVTQKTISEYDSDNNLTYFASENPADAENYLSETVNEYSGGLLIKRSTASKTKDGKLKYAADYLYSYNEDLSYTHTMILYDFNGEVIGEYSSDYDSEGNPIE